MRRLKIILWILKNFEVKSIFIAFLILSRKKLRISNLSKEHVVKLNYRGNALKFCVKENDSILALTDTFSSEIYGNKVCKNNKIIFDCGAHIGTSAVFFSLMNPESKVYCFEPDKSSFKLLEKNLKLNRINSESYNFAISDKNGLVSFNSDLNCSVSSRIKENGNTKIQSRNIDTLMKKLKIGNVDLLKLDIEGEEVNVLSKLTNPKKIKNLVCEVHAQYYPPSQLKNVIKKKGFKIHSDPEKEKFSSLFASR